MAVTRRYERVTPVLNRLPEQRLNLQALSYVNAPILTTVNKLKIFTHHEVFERRAIKCKRKDCYRHLTT